MSDSLTTKKALADSLRALMKKKSLEKITVSDLVKNSGLNRQTFYYHFRDKYDLVNWIIDSEIISAFSSAAVNGSWSDSLLEALSLMKREKVFYIGALTFARESAFLDDMFPALRDMLLDIVDQVPLLSGRSIDPNNKLFIADFYTHGLIGMVYQWARNGMREPPETIVGRLTRFVDDSKHASSERYLKTDCQTQRDGSERST